MLIGSALCESAARPRAHARTRVLDDEDDEEEEQDEEEQDEDDEDDEDDEHTGRARQERHPSARVSQRCPRTPAAQRNDGARLHMTHRHLAGS
eukprot:2149739-Pyramimonas_sp.AAC.1